MTNIAIHFPEGETTVITEGTGKGKGKGKDVMQAQALVEAVTGHEAQYLGGFEALESWMASLQADTTAEPDSETAVEIAAETAVEIAAHPDGVYVSVPESEQTWKFILLNEHTPRDRRAVELELLNSSWADALHIFRQNGFCRGRRNQQSPPFELYVDDQCVTNLALMFENTTALKSSNFVVWDAQLSWVRVIASREEDVA